MTTEDKIELANKVDEAVSKALGHTHFIVLYRTDDGKYVQTHTLNIQDMCEFLILIKEGLKIITGLSNENYKIRLDPIYDDILKNDARHGQGDPDVDANDREDDSQSPSKEGFGV